MVETETMNVTPNSIVLPSRRGGACSSRIPTIICHKPSVNGQSQTPVPTANRSFLHRRAPLRSLLLAKIFSLFLKKYS